MNITETCDRPENGKIVLNLITDTEVAVASAPDNGFLEQALVHTQETVSDKIEKVYADGAYHSTDNQEYCRDEDQ